MKYRTVIKMGQTVIAALSVCLLLSAAAIADNFAANVSKLDGKAFVASIGGVTRTLQINDRLYERDRVITSRDTSLDITFTDGTVLTLGASTIIRVDSYKYRKKNEPAKADAAEEGFSTFILKGVVRAITGLLAKRRPFSVKFRMKVATIGIRGTHFTAEVDGDSATIILLAQKDTKASNAIEVSNAYGKVEINKPGWGTEIPDAKSPPSPPRQMRSMNSMSRILRSIQTTGRVRIPRSPRH